MSSPNLSTNYISSVQRIEAFCSFFDRLTSSSPNYHVHTQSLNQFKTMLYKNITNPKGISDIQATYSSTLDPLKEPQININALYPQTSQHNNKLTSNNESLTSLNDALSPVQNREGGPSLQKLSENFASQARISHTSSMENIGIATSTYNAGSRDYSNNPALQPSTNANATSSYFENTTQQSFGNISSIFDFLSTIKAVEHSDMNNLFPMATEYSHARSFPSSKQGVFQSLSFAFFEKIILKPPKAGQFDVVDPMVSKVLNKEVENAALRGLKPSYTDFLWQLKGFIEGKDTSIAEKLCSDRDTHEASMTLFKEIALEILTLNGNVQRIISQSSPISFEWMNQSSEQDKPFYQRFAEVMRATITIIRLKYDVAEKETFTYVPTQQLTSPTLSPQKLKMNSETVVFYDDRLQSSYLIYRSRDSKISAQSTDLYETSYKNVNIHKPPKPSSFLPNGRSQTFDLKKRGSIMVPSSYQIQHEKEMRLFGRDKIRESVQPRSLQDISNIGRHDSLASKSKEPAPIPYRGGEGAYSIKISTPGHIQNFKTEIEPLKNTESSYESSISIGSGGLISNRNMIGSADVSLYSPFLGQGAHENKGFEVTASRDVSFLSNGGQNMRNIQANFGKDNYDMLSASMGAVGDNLSVNQGSATMRDNLLDMGQIIQGSSTILGGSQVMGESSPYVGQILNELSSMADYSIRDGYSISRSGSVLKDLGTAIEPKSIADLVQSYSVSKLENNDEVRPPRSSIEGGGRSSIKVMRLLYSMLLTV